MKKIITTGSIAIDHVFLVDKLPNKGQSIISKKFNIFCGGKGANQAVSLGKLGAQVQMIGHVGEDNAADITINNLKENNIDTTYVTKIPGYNTQIANIIIDDNGDNLLIVDIGASFSYKKEEVKVYHELIDNSDIALTQLETSIEFIEEFLRYAYSKNKMIILNPGPARELKKEIIEMCDFITPNETELCILTKKEYTEDLIKLEEYAKELQTISKKHVIVTLGERGALWVDEKGQTKKYDAYKLKAIDATAAGDTFMGAFVTYLSQDKSIEESILFGIGASALTVTKLGAQSSLPSLEEVNKFISQNK